MLYDRMTSYSLEKLTSMAREEKVELCKGHRGLPGCRGALLPKKLPIGAIMNEIGTIFYNDGTPGAEEVLTELFNKADDPRIGGVAYFYLSQKKDDLKPETLAKVRAFEDDPANAEIVQDVKNKIREFTGEVPV